mmetsp:Transcript_24446/g.61314  ORF Transcript_24446/g.61314 Transcript_24446/m.61314 type:complete len:234 (+) Transcript_24446:2518-3219(+)
MQASPTRRSAAWQRSGSRCWDSAPARCRRRPTSSTWAATACWPRSWCFGYASSSSSRSSRSRSCCATRPCAPWWRPLAPRKPDRRAHRPSRRRSRWTWAPRWCCPRMCATIRRQRVRRVCCRRGRPLAWFSSPVAPASWAHTCSVSCCVARRCAWPVWCVRGTRRPACCDCERTWRRTTSGRRSSGGAWRWCAATWPSRIWVSPTSSTSGWRSNATRCCTTAHWCTGSSRTRS